MSKKNFVEVIAIVVEYSGRSEPLNLIERASRSDAESHS